MNEKKNLTPHAIEDDALNDVAGGAFFAGNFLSAMEQSGILESESKSEYHSCSFCYTPLAKEDVYYLSHRSGRKFEVCKSCYDLYPQLQLPR